MKIKHVVIPLLLLTVAGVAAGLWLSTMLQAPGPLEITKTVYIEPGSPVKKISAMLEENGVIDSALAFSLGARLQKSPGGLKAGEYAFTPQMSANDVIALLQSGKTYHRMITVAEGLMSVEIVDIITHAEMMTGMIDTPPEGSLLPETYSYSYNDSRAVLVSRMQKSMAETLNALWEKRAPDCILKSPQETVILASIVEKETSLAAERPRVAGVFTNRLKAGMPLQSDPTVIYAVTLGQKKLDHPLTRNELNMESPYNTYTVKGLPPGPIANPGKASLEAVLHPEENNYLYFVADGSGGHAFAATLDEHTRNVGKWRALENARK